MSNKPTSLTTFRKLLVGSGLAVVGTWAGLEPGTALATTVLTTATNVAAGAGTNFISNWSEQRLPQFVELWFSKDGVLNHDIARALGLALERAVEQIKPQIEQHEHYKRLKGHKPEVADRFLTNLTAIGEEGEELILQWSKQPRPVMSAWLQGDSDKLEKELTDNVARKFFGHETTLVEWLKKRLVLLWLLNFEEVLKEPSENGTKAWRACQRLWQTSLSQAVVEMRDEWPAERKALEDFVKAWDERLKDEQQKNEIRRKALAQAVEKYCAGIEEDIKTLLRKSNDIKDDTETIIIKVGKIDQGVEQTYQGVEQIKLDIEQIKESIRTQPHVRIPLQRPPRPEHFTGREAELLQILSRLQPGRVVTLSGPGGIGKSALAAEAIWRLSPTAFPDGIIFHDFYQEPLASQALEGIASAFGDHAGQSTPRVVRRILSGRNALLVLDGAERADDLDKVVNVRGECGVLITSRNREHKSDERLDIGPLPIDDAVKLLQEWGGKWAIDETAAPAICNLVGGLPLAVRLVGRYLDSRNEKAVEYLEWLEETPLIALDRGKRSLDSVPILLDKSLQQVSEDARQALAVVGLLAFAPFTQEVVADVLAIRKWKARELLGELLNYGLLVRRDDPYEVTHALIHTYAQERLIQPDKESTGQQIERFIAHYFSFVQEAAGKEEFFDEVEQAHPHILKALERAKEGVEEEGESARQRMIEFVDATDRHWQTHNQYDVQVEWLQEAYTCADALGQPLPQASFAQRIGHVLSIQKSQLDEALKWMERAESHLTNELDPGPNSIRGLVHIHRASALYQQGKLKEAKEECRRGLKMVNQTEQPAVLAEGYNLLGSILGRSGEDLEARQYLKQSLAIWQDLGNKYKIARVNNNIAITHKRLGEMNQARDFYAKGLEYWKTRPDQSHLAIALNNSGSVDYILSQCLLMAGWSQEAMTHRDKAENDYGQAAQISEQLGMQRLLALLKMNSAGVQIARQDWDEAESCLNQSLEIQHSQNINVYLPETYRAQAEVALGRAQYRAATTRAKNALEAAKDQGNQSEEAAAHRVLGKAYRLSRKPTQARKHLETSRDILNKLQNPFETALTWQELANFYRMQKNLVQYQRAKGVVKQILAKMEIVKKESSNG